jgi:hypothetical protein
VCRTASRCSGLSFSRKVIGGRRIKYIARCEVRGARCEVRGARCEVRGARREVRGARCARCEVRGARGARGARCEVRGAKGEARCARCGARGAGRGARRKERRARRAVVCNRDDHEQIPRRQSRPARAHGTRTAGQWNPARTQQRDHHRSRNTGYAKR